MSSKNYPMTATAAEISRNFGDWQHRAMLSPVMITHHGRPRLVLASVSQFEGQDDVTSSMLGNTDHSHHNACLRVVLNQMKDGFIAFDAQLRVQEVNPAAELYIGLGRDELIGHDLRDLAPETRPSIAWGIYERILRNGEPTDFRIKSSIHNGPLRLQAFPYLDGVAVIFTNLASSEEARILERRSEAMHAALECEPSMSMMRLNARGGIEAVDSSFCKMSGFGDSQLLSLMLSEIIYPRDRPVLNRALNACIRDRKPTVAVVTLMARDGAERSLHLCMSAAFHDAVPEEVIVCAIDPSGFQSSKTCEA